MKSRVVLCMWICGVMGFLACEQPPPPTPQAEEEVPEAYKIMMANRQGKTSNTPTKTEPSSDTDDTDDYAIQAQAALTQGKLDTTIKLCEDAQAKGEPCITSHAMAHYLRGDNDKACKLFKKAKAVDALSTELIALYTVRCMNTVVTDNTEELVEAIDAAAQKYFADMTDSEAKERASELGKDANKKVFSGDSYGAIADCKLAITKGYSDCHRIMGVAYKMNGDTPKACESFKQALVYKPKNAAGLEKQMEDLGCE